MRREAALKEAKAEEGGGRMRRWGEGEGEGEGEGKGRGKEEG